MVLYIYRVGIASGYNTSYDCGVVLIYSVFGVVVVATRESG